MIPKYRFIYLNKFEKELERLSVQDRQTVSEKIKIIANDPRYQSKKVESVPKNRKDVFETRVNKDIRLFWEYDDEDDDVIVLLRVGHHDILKNIQF